MILIMVGTHEAPFERLVSAAAALPEDLDVVIQSGWTPVPPTTARVHDFLPFDELDQLIHDADVVVTHAGVGSIMVTLAAGKLPIVVPRLSRFDEHLDDHQLELARRLSEARLVDVLEDVSDLQEAVSRVSSQAPRQPDEVTPLARELGAYLDSLDPDLLDCESSAVTPAA